MAEEVTRETWKKKENRTKEPFRYVMAFLGWCFYLQ